MNMKTEFQIGQKVYIIFKENNLVKLFADEVVEINIRSNGVYYYGKVMCEDFKEDELVDINAKEVLIEKIEKLTSEESDDK